MYGEAGVAGNPPAWPAPAGLDRFLQAHCLGTNPALPPPPAVIRHPQSPAGFSRSPVDTRGTYSNPGARVRGSQHIGPGGPRARTLAVVIPRLFPGFFGRERRADPRTYAPRRRASSPPIVPACVGVLDGRTEKMKKGALGNPPAGPFLNCPAFHQDVWASRVVRRRLLGLME